MISNEWLRINICDEYTNKDKDINHLIDFWNRFYDRVLSDISVESEKRNQNSRPSNQLKYKSSVIQLLEEEKAKFPLAEEELIRIQGQIENISMLFDEESIHKSCPDIIKMLIKENEECARDYLRRTGQLSRFDSDELLSEFGHYTIEGLIVHVLSMLFNPVDSKGLMVRLPLLVEQLEKSVRMQAFLLRCRRYKINYYEGKKEFLNQFMNTHEKRVKLAVQYPFGAGLVQFMEEKGLITLTTDLVGTSRAMTKGGNYYLPKSLFAVCNFDISLLPIKLNLPMVCKPKDWTCICPRGQKPRTISDLTGGYLSGPTLDFYERYRLLSTGDANHYYIDISRDQQADNLCRVMNKLQGQAFQIHSSWLSYIIDNEDSLVEKGLLMPSILTSFHLNDLTPLLREFYMNDEFIKSSFRFSTVLNTLSKNIQRARYERYILKLASAYNGYHFYLPAFLDFRGRIYRCGVLHFHERDLARSLILFANSNCSKYDKKQVIAQTAFHYKSFVSVEESRNWLSENLDNINNNLFEFARNARHPFQFICNIVSYCNDPANTTNLINAPITQDASASAYQIMSYFLLDIKMAMRTNLIPSPDGKIQDVYSFFLEELKEYLMEKAELSIKDIKTDKKEEKRQMNKSLANAVCKSLDRKLVKSIFMPIIYGKTLRSTVDDLIDSQLTQSITERECYTVAYHCFQFWKEKYSGLNSLIQLIRSIGWIASARECPVFYRVPYFTTVQDYMKMEPINIRIYDRLNKRCRQVTLRIPTENRDRRKTEIATFVNFIHQKDAQIAMGVVESMLNTKAAPMYTVHDNFITTSSHSDFLPKCYSKVVGNLGAPLIIINEFIYMNVIKHILVREQPHADLNNGAMFYDHGGVIEKDILTYYLEQNIPSNLSKKARETWNGKIQLILDSYKEYCRIVCNGQDLDTVLESSDAHQRHWKHFQKRLEPEMGNSYYCLHH